MEVQQCIPCNVHIHVTVSKVINIETVPWKHSKHSLYCCTMYVPANNMKHTGLHIKCLIFLFEFKQIWSLLTDFHNSPSVTNFSKIHAVGAMLIHADRPWNSTDMKKLRGAYYNIRTYARTTMILTNDFVSPFYSIENNINICGFPCKGSDMTVQF